MSQIHDHSHGCSCCSAGLDAAWSAAARAGLSRREPAGRRRGTAAVSSWFATARTAAVAAEQSPASQPAVAEAKELVVQPIVTYNTPQRREQTSWRPWGGIQTREQIDAEVKKIERRAGQTRRGRRACGAFSAGRAGEYAAGGQGGFADAV